MTTSDVARRDDARPGVLARHPLVSFFVLAYAGAWLLELPVVLSRTGTGLLPYTLPPVVVLVLIAGATFTGPTVAAFVMVRVTEGEDGPKRLLRRYVMWRVKLRWYLFVLLVIPASVVLGAIVLPGVLASYQPVTLGMALGYPLAFVATFVLGGPLGEEPGWRGFALPRLQAAYGPLIGSIVLGVLWASWHLPLFWSGVWTPPTVANMVMFLVMITLLTIVMTWVFNNVGWQPADHHAHARVLQHVREQDRGADLPRPAARGLRLAAGAGRVRCPGRDRRRGDAGPARPPRRASLAGAGPRRPAVLKDRWPPRSGGCRCGRAAADAPAQQQPHPVSARGKAAQTDVGGMTGSGPPPLGSRTDRSWGRQSVHSTSQAPLRSRQTGLRSSFVRDRSSGSG